MTDITHVGSSTRDLRLEAGGEVDILLTSASVRIRGVEGDRVIVRASRGEDIDDEVSMESAPGRVIVRDADRGFKLGPIRVRLNGSADLEIDVPKSARISCKTLSGDVDATGLAGDTRWASASGDIRLRLDGGSLTAESMSGDVIVESAGSISIKARSVSGDVRIHAPRIERLGASTTSGDVRVEGELGEGEEHSISSISGDVELVTKSPVRVSTQTITGDVRASGTHTAEGGRGRRTIVSGAGSVPVGIRTTSGDIRLRGSGSAPTVPAAPTAPAAPAVIAPQAPVAPAAPLAPVAPAAATLAPAYVVAEAEAAPNLVRPTRSADDGPADPPSLGTDGLAERREAVRLEVLRALERGDLDIEAASWRLEQIDGSGPLAFRGWQ